jgi:Na+/melibiose symporter-like transporter
LVYLGFSLASIAHNSWGASLTWERGERARLTAVREGCGLLGVILAAAVPAVFGLAWLSVLFSISLLLCAFVLLRFAPKGRHTAVNTQAESLFSPLRNKQFLSLLSVFASNGIAAAIPASLFLFFVSDRLQLASYAGLFLVLYFLAAACALPLWIKLAREFGEALSWLVAMALALASFIWAANLVSGSLLGFALVCIASGIALGADLALPPALLAAVIGVAGDDGHREGTYFGIWSWTTKMNLALAAGISLPLLEYLGYSPGSTTPSSSSALVIAYVWLPCLLKCIAMFLLWRAPLKNL